ncbi:MAG: RIP metalloprotease RseP [Prevotellaceae bacterium]|jgi:regulator of sigma E protease|nr:RIP metalloprotease RseP [Prevotellaceae bacterium]
MQFLQLIFSLTLLVFFHELGHFFFSKLFKVRVEKFYLFFNPAFALVRAKKIDGRWRFRFLASNDSIANNELWQRNPENTEWGIGWLPLGGYCKIAGMIDESMDKAQMATPPKPWEYRSVSPWKRLPIIAGGVLVNFVMALLIYGAILFAWGEKFVPIENYRAGFEFSPVAQQAGFRNGDLLVSADGQAFTQYNEASLRRLINAKTVTISREGKQHSIALPDDFGEKIIAHKEFCAMPRLPFVIGETVKNSPAQQVGLLAGDSLVSIDNTVYYSFFDFAKVISENRQQPVNIGFYRNGEAHTITVSPDSSGVIGVRPRGYSELFGSVTREYSLLESIPAGVSLGWQKLSGYVSDFKYLFSKTGVESLGGFKSIGNMYDTQWNWAHLWEMTAFLSIILAFMNILPIPGLDGGHLLFVLYEIVTRRKPSQQFLERAQLLGMVFLISLMIFANLNDFI